MELINTMGGMKSFTKDFYISAKFTGLKELLNSL